MCISVLLRRNYLVFMRLSCVQTRCACSANPDAHHANTAVRLGSVRFGWWALCVICTGIYTSGRFAKWRARCGSLVLWIFKTIKKNSEALWKKKSKSNETIRTDRFTLRAVSFRTWSGPWCSSAEAEPQPAILNRTKDRFSGLLPGLKIDFTLYQLKAQMA